MVNDETPILVCRNGFHGFSLRAEIRTNMTYDDRKIVSCCDIVGLEHRWRLADLKMKQFAQ